MSGYLIRRILWMIPTIFAVLLITFVIMHATPGGPWDVSPDSRTSDPRVQAALDKAYGLDKPLYINPEAAQKASAAGKDPIAVAQAFFDTQFGNYLSNLSKGDLGPSYRFRGRRVQDVIAEAPVNKPFYQSRFGTTIFLGVLAMLMALVIGFPLGLIAGLKQNTVVDNASLLVATIGYGIPSFVLGIFFIFVFAVWLGWINVLEFDYWDRWQAWMLPALTLAIPTGAYVARLTRSSVIEVMRQDYIRTARAKGLPERLVVFRHIIRNSMIPVVTFIGPALAGLVTGSFIIESQFSVNGIGRLFVESINRRDYTMILALTIIYAILVAVANLVVDIVYGFLDPRIKVGGGRT
ncbi:MAG: ABC transporter permease [Chloroflexi bacterium]|nr:ABC transporter permease [Chloroflexota bacterium]